MGYLNCFNAHEDYENSYNELVTPSVSYCEFEGEVHYNAISKIIAHYGIPESGETEIEVYTSDAMYSTPQYIKEIKIDGQRVTEDDFNNDGGHMYFDFQTEGGHIVEFTLNAQAKVPMGLLYSCKNVFAINLINVKTIPTGPTPFPLVTDNFLSGITIYGSNLPTIEGNNGLCDASNVTLHIPDISCDDFSASKWGSYGWADVICKTTATEVFPVAPFEPVSPVVT